MSSQQFDQRSGAPSGRSGGRSQSGRGGSSAGRGQRSEGNRGRQGGSAVVYSAGPDTARAARASKAFGVSSFLDSAFPEGAAPVRAERPTDTPARTRSEFSARTRSESPTRGQRSTEAPARSTGDRPAADRSRRRSEGQGGQPARRPARESSAPQQQRTNATTPRRDNNNAVVASANSLFANATTITADAAPLDGITFAELGVPTALIAPLAALGAESPFPIQAATLPNSLSGRDVLGRGRTGSGKTIAFAIPLVARLTGGRRTPHRPRGLVLLPTRELALQVQRTIEPLAKAAGLKTVTIFGGVGFGSQISALRSGVDIVIACPGRLEDLISQKACNLNDVEVTVLDEADHMADLGFLPGVRRLLRATRPDGQRLLFSATLDNGISVLVNDFLTDPAVHAVDDETSPVSSMSHHVFSVTKDDRAQVIRELASGGGRRLLFTRTKYGAKKWAATLSKFGIPAVDLHGNLAQNARERNLAAFSDGSAKVLVATDIAARGIHVDDIELVVHLDPPAEHKAYLHRSGRTARAGAGGAVVTVMLPEQADDVRKLMKQAGISASTTAVRPGHPAIGKLAS